MIKFEGAKKQWEYDTTHNDLFKSVKDGLEVLGTFMSNTKENKKENKIIRFWPYLGGYTDPEDHNHSVFAIVRFTNGKPEIIYKSDIVSKPHSVLNMFVSESIGIAISNTSRRFDLAKQDKEKINELERNNTAYPWKAEDARAQEMADPGKDTEKDIPGKQ